MQGTSSRWGGAYSFTDVAARMAGKRPRGPPAAFLQPLRGFSIAAFRILTESMAVAGATVTGIDMADKPLGVARLHQLESGADVEYLQATAEEHASQRPGQYDVVTCLEMLEHVPSPSRVVASVTELVRPGGHVFFSTINRNPKSFLFAIVGAEYVLRLLPAGTHEYQKFIRPSELESWARSSGLEHRASIGLHYNPLTRDYSLGPNVDVNYLMYFRRPETV